MRDIYMQQLKDLKRELSDMGLLVQEAIGGAVTALKEMDKEKAKLVIKMDTLIDHKEKEIESACLHMLLQQNPMAKDLRQISSALKMITDLERIGDHATDISEIVLLLEDMKYESILEDILKMSHITSRMVSGCLVAYINQDLETANEVISMDDKVDEIFLKIKNEIAFEVKKDTVDGMQALDLLLIAKYFERIGDHAENVGEWVVFSITGVHKNERVI